MPYAFDHLDFIQRILESHPFGLITDFDGTISETAPTPGQAKVSQTCRGYLSILSGHLALVAAISGRPVSQVREMVGVEGILYIGNHGLERWSEGETKIHASSMDYPKVIEEVLAELDSLLPKEGIIYENKGITATIHYRLAPQPQQMEQKILDILKGSSTAQNLRIIRGKRSLSLIPMINADKGSATVELISEYKLRGCIYFGDDYTDIDAFRAIHTIVTDWHFQGIAIAIAGTDTPEEISSESDFTLKGVADVERFLRWMTETGLQSSQLHPRACT